MKVLPIAAYPSPRQVGKDLNISGYTENARSVDQKREQKLGWVIAHRFLEPARVGRSEKGLLKQTVALANSEEYKRHRAEFYKWQDELIKNGFTDDEILKKMVSSLKTCNDMVKKEMGNVYRKFAFTVVGAGINIAGTALNLFNLAGGFVSIANFALFDLPAARQQIGTSEQGSPMAMFRAAHKHLRWR